MPALFWRYESRQLWSGRNRDSANFELGQFATRGQCELVLHSVPVSNIDLQAWLRLQCAEFVFQPAGVYVEQGKHTWPLIAHDHDELTSLLEAGGHLVSLPKESAALANVIEVALVDFLLARIEAIPGAIG